MLRFFMADLKMMLRNRQALFWSFMFPLMFTFIFGFFFGKNTSTGTIVLINQSNTELSKNVEKALLKSDLFKINDEKNLETAKDLIKKGKISNAVAIPENFGVQNNAETKIVVYYDPANSQANAAVNGLLDKVLTEVNFSIQNAKPIYTISQENVGTKKELGYFDFVLAGILGLALMNSSIHGIAIGMTKYREDQILKRITTTPLKTWWFIASEIASRLILNFLQIAVILVIGKYVFNAHIYGNLVVIFAISILGALLFQLMGFVIASFSKTTNAAEGMATAITIPMMFLGGVFFPIDTLPKYLYQIVQYLPLAPLLRILRGVVLEGSSPFLNPINITIVLAWIIICSFISIKKFKLVEE